MREGPIVNCSLIRTLFKPDELERWFGTTDIRDDDGTGHSGTPISQEAANEIVTRYYERPVAAVWRQD